jgi:hypothetical protein
MVILANACFFQVSFCGATGGRILTSATAQRAEIISNFLSVGDGEKACVELDQETAVAKSIDYVASA